MMKLEFVMLSATKHLGTQRVRSFAAAQDDKRAVDVFLHYVVQ